MTSWHGNALRITGLLSGGSTVEPWIHSHHENCCKIIHHKVFEINIFENIATSPRAHELRRFLSVCSMYWVFLWVITRMVLPGKGRHADWRLPDPLVPRYFNHLENGISCFWSSKGYSKPMTRQEMIIIFQFCSRHCVHCSIVCRISIGVTMT